ncbi:DsbC family protein [Isoalcanivorax indicus]|uniref:DsbC family protein n=1 Tax=Isoalcanivorax indicus TaxID=2202653 RepID=UPI000DB8FE3B|nr:DsbC family protein [Isoalcanivorax indicus]
MKLFHAGLLASSLMLSLILPAAVAAGDDAELKRRIEASLGSSGQPVRVTDVAPSQIPGVVEVVVNGAERFFASADGRYLIAGDMYEMQASGPVNVIDKRLESVREALFKDLDAAELVSFAAKDEKAQLIVFTDPSCGYCRRLHEDMEALNRAGVTVHYLAYPRAGADSQPGEQMQQIWCASDRQKAMTDAKLRGRVSERVQVRGGCGDTVAEQYRLGARAGVRGTPAVFTLDGRQLGGYMPADRLIETLGLGG